MLVIKAYINSTLIDEIHIRNIDGDPNGTCTYVIEDPPDYKHLIRHSRPLGWRNLAYKVLQYMSGQDESRAYKLEDEEIAKKAKAKKYLADLITQPL